MDKQNRTHDSSNTHEELAPITIEVSISLPLISLRGYALRPEDVSRMRKNAEDELRETRKELGYAY